MNDDFKEKLELYDRGEMTPDEKIEFEKEMDAKEKQWMKPGLDKNKQRKILRASKWKARIGTAFSALAFLLLALIISSFATNLYYYGFSSEENEENRAQKLSNIIDYGTLITDPYGIGRTNNREIGTFFTMDVTKDLKRIVGKEVYTVGEMKVNFLFSKMGFPEVRNFNEVEEDYQLKFNHPNSHYQYAIHTPAEWDRLEMLPEGTVATAFLSFDKLVSTQEVFERFENRDLDILWFPVDVYSKEDLDADGFSLEEPIGFPNNPILHTDDWKLESKVEERTLFGSQVVETTHSAMSYENGDVDMLHKQFMKTLQFLEEHEDEYMRLRQSGMMKLHEQIDFLENNGIKHYGVVITGPSKEILALKEEDWADSIHIDDVALWNWTN